MKKHLNLFLTLLSLWGLGGFLLSGCTDVVTVSLPQPVNRLAVDGWLTDQPGNQLIRLRLTTSYLDTLPAPAATGATVSVTDITGKIFNFTEDKATGNYLWQPQPGERFGNTGMQYTLRISYKGENYEAVSQMNPVPPIDSISSELRKNQLGTDDGYYATLNARDLPEVGNCYWIRTFKNGKYLNKPSEINLAYDAAFKNSGVNNQPFIVPIADAINPNTTDRKPPYAIDDVIRVEIRSITPEAYDFINTASNEMTNGGLFATIPSNVSTNIKTLNDKASGKAVGFFCVCAVSEASVVVKK
jgi:hypothetical protein